MDATNPTTTIIIVNWNGQRWLSSCLPCLANQTYRDFAVVVVDNGSTDGSVAWLTAEWPQVQVIVQPKNIGFAPANNIGIRATTSDHVVLLNNDTKPAPDWLAQMVAGVDGPNVGMVAAQIVQWQDETKLDSAGIVVDWAGLAWQRGWNRPVSCSEASTPDDVFGPSGAAALYRRTMLDEIGLFADEFFAYYEDVDLAWRAQNAGWRCRYMPTARVAHWHSATSATMGSRKQFLVARNKWWTIIRNYPLRRLLFAWPLIGAYDLASLLYQVGKTGRLTPLHARLSALRHLRHQWQQRRPPVQPAPLIPPPPFNRH